MIDTEHDLLHNVVQVVRVLLVIVGPGQVVVQDVMMQIIVTIAVIVRMVYKIVEKLELIVVVEDVVHVLSIVVMEFNKVGGQKCMLTYCEDECALKLVFSSPSSMFSGWLNGPPPKIRETLLFKFS